MNILDFINASVYNLGRVAIQFRNEYHKNLKTPSNSASWYALNSFRDGWFRVNDSYQITYTFGLKIKEFEISGINKTMWGKGYAIKAQLTYETPANVIETTPAWLYVEDDVDLNEVEKYIEDNKKFWVD